MRLTAGILACFALTAVGQAPAPLRFEVVSVKLSNPANDHSASGVETKRGRLTATNVTLKRCILGAYGIRPHQIVGGPDWLDADTFDILAKADEPVGDEMLSRMMQTLLAERFKLAFHRETRTMQAFVLEAGRSAPKLEKADGGEGKTVSSRGGLDARNISMNRFAEVLSRQMDLPVVNLTAIEGVFNVKLKWTPEGAAGAAALPADAPPAIFTAIQEQLGLRLRSQKTPIEVLVIDHAEKPGEN